MWLTKVPKKTIKLILIIIYKIAKTYIFWFNDNFPEEVTDLDDLLDQWSDDELL